MKRPAPDVDQLMWMLAEQRDMKAVEEFEERFPDLRLELAKRVALVNGLRSAREAPPATIPRFRAPEPRMSVWRRPTLAIASAALLAVFAFGAYAGTRAWLDSRQEPTRDETPVQAGPAPGTSQIGDAEPFRAPKPAVPNVSPPAQADPVAAEAIPPYERPHSVRIDQAPLSAVIDAIALQTGLEVEIAPGMPEFNVSAQYENATGLQMLQDLGRRYQFTALSQGGNRVLIVPVVDAGRGDREPPQAVRGPG